MRFAGKAWRRRFLRLETIAVTALHAFPTLYCHSKSLQAGSPIAVILDAYRQMLRVRLSKMPLWLRTLVVFSWPPMVILCALGQTIVNGRFIAKRYRRGVMMQFIDQIRLAFADGVPPIFYYLYELHEPRNRPRAHEYIPRAYLKNRGLYKRLYRAVPEQRQRAKVLNDKFAFHQFCKEHNLRTVHVYALAEDAALSWTDPHQQRIPERSLFIKPRNSNGGSGAERWLFRDGHYVGKDGCSLDSQAFTRHLAELSRANSYLIQECLDNHPELAQLTAGALSTLRMYTFVNERGGMEHIFSMFKMSQDPECVVDNIHRGGLAARVDPVTGELGRATDAGKLARTGWLDRHPVTGAQITGFRLAFWQQALDMALLAHQKLPEAYVIGWDVAITADGPCIVEGNKAPDIEIEQRLDGPWGNERFGQCLAYHLEQVAGSQWPAREDAVYASRSGQGTG